MGSLKEIEERKQTLKHSDKKMKQYLLLALAGSTLSYSIGLYDLISQRSLVFGIVNLTIGSIGFGYFIFAWNETKKLIKRSALIMEQLNDLEKLHEKINLRKQYFEAITLAVDEERYEDAARLRETYLATNIMNTNE